MCVIRVYFLRNLPIIVYVNFQECNGSISPVRRLISGMNSVDIWRATCFSTELGLAGMAVTLTYNDYCGYNSAIDCTIAHGIIAFIYACIQ